MKIILTTTDQCDHFNASFISSTNRSLLGKSIINQYTAVEFTDTLGKIFEAIKQGSLQKVQSLVNIHQQRSNNLSEDPEFRWDIINDLSLNWSPLHHSIYQGRESIFLWFLSVGGDISLNTYDGYSALTLAVLSRSELMVNLLIAQPNLNVNHISRKGSALHIAVLSNQLSILKLLLQHPIINLNIYNYQQQQPLDIATGKAKELLEKELQQRTDFYQELKQSQISILSSDYNQLNTLNTFMINRPQKPPIYKGYVRKLHFSQIYSYPRYIVIDPDSGILVRFENKENCPMNPKETIPLQDIFNLQIIIKDRTFTDSSINLLIEYNQKKIYFLFQSLKIAQVWYESIKIAVGYSKYVKNKIDQYKQKKDNKKIFYQVNVMLSEIDNNSVEIDSGFKYQSQNNENIKIQSRSKKQFLKNIKFSDFDIQQRLSKRSNQQIYLSKYLKNTKIYILKQYSKEQLLDYSEFEHIFNEIKLLKKISHPFIISLKGLFQTKNNLYQVMKHYKNGDLSQYIGQGFILSENISKILIAQIILAIEYLHSLNIIYRCLKPKNVFVGNKGFLKLADFRLAKEIINDRLNLSICGSLEYLAPEIIKGEDATEFVDIYGLGVLLYEMLSGYPPHFIEDDDDSMLEKKQLFPINYERIKSKMAVKILKQMLQKDQTKRPNLQDVKNHVFFADMNWNKLLTKNILPPKLNKTNQQQFIQEQMIFETIKDYDYLDQEEKQNYVEDWSLS